MPNHAYLAALLWNFFQHLIDICMTEPQREIFRCVVQAVVVQAKFLAPKLLHFL